MNGGRTILCLLLLGLFTGCGATRLPNSLRTGTEQLLISDAIDHAVEQIDFRLLADQTVFLEERYVTEPMDRAYPYLISSLKQRMMACGCILKNTREEAEFVVEPRSGGIGTDNHDLLFGIPAVQVPQVGALTGVPAAIPEIAIAKRQNQRATAKIGVFAYHRETGKPVWQSGLAKDDSASTGVWVMGAGPFQKGAIHEGTSFAGGSIASALELPAELPGKKRKPPAAISQPAIFNAPVDLVAKKVEPPKKLTVDANAQPLPTPESDGAVQPAGFEAKAP